MRAGATRRRTSRPRDAREVLCFLRAVLYTRGVSAEPNDEPLALSPAPRRDAPRPRLDARTTGWLLEQRARIGALELENARLRGELDTSARVERGAQRVCDRLEAELDRARQREARLAHALGYAEAERDRLASELAAGAALPELPEAARPSPRRGLLRRGPA